MNLNYKFAGNKYDDKVEFSAQNGVIKRKSTIYSMVTTGEDGTANTVFNAKTTDLNLLISELGKDLVNADQEVQSARIQRDIYIQIIEKFINRGLISAEQYQSTINESIAELEENQSGKSPNK